MSPRTRFVSRRLALSLQRMQAQKALAAAREARVERVHRAVDLVLTAVLTVVLVLVVLATLVAAPLVKAVDLLREGKARPLPPGPPSSIPTRSPTSS